MPTLTEVGFCRLLSRDSCTACNSDKRLKSCPSGSRRGGRLGGPRLRIGERSLASTATSLSLSSRGHKHFQEFSNGLPGDGLCFSSANHEEQRVQESRSARQALRAWSRRTPRGPHGSRGATPGDPADGLMHLGTRVGGLQRLEVPSLLEGLVNREPEVRCVLPVRLPGNAQLPHLTKRGSVDSSERGGVNSAQLAMQ